MAFADHYPLADFLAISHISWWRSSDVQSVISREATEVRKLDATYKIPAELRALQRKAETADALDKPVWEAGKERFEEALAAHLADLRSEGRLAPTGGMRGRDVWQATEWNAIAAGEEGDGRGNWLIGLIGRILVHHFVRMDTARSERRRSAEPGSHQAPSRADAEAAWTAICAAMDSGDSKCSYMGWAIECQDGKTGDRCELHFHDWKAVLMRRTPKHQLEIAPDVGPLPLVAASFDVPTGELLLTDTLRVDGFDDAIDFADDEHGEELSLSSAEGRSNRTRAHAAVHGMGFCQTTNTSVLAWRHPVTGAIAVVPRWSGDEEDADGDSPVAGWEKIGSFSCDIWRITAIDRATAAALAAPGAIDAHLALRGTDLDTSGMDTTAANQAHHAHCYADNVVNVQVPVGRWTIHCGDDFHKRLPRGRFGLPKGVMPWCVLTPPKKTRKRAA